MYDTKRSREEFEDSFKFKDEKTGETSDSELSDFLDEINTDMMVFGDEQEMGFDENIGEAIRERLFSWSESPMISSESDEELKPADSWDMFQGETVNSLMEFPTFEVRVESPKKKKRKRVQNKKSSKKKKKRRRKSSSEDSGEPNARRDIALKRKRKMGRFVESEWEFVPISKVL